MILHDYAIDQQIDTEASSRDHASQRRYDWPLLHDCRIAHRRLEGGGAGPNLRNHMDNAIDQGGCNPKQYIEAQKRQQKKKRRSPTPSSTNSEVAIISIWNCLHHTLIFPKVLVGGALD